MVEGVTDEEADVIPEGFHNNIRWNLGHIYLDQFLWIQAITKETTAIASLNKWFGFGTSPKDFTKDTPTLQALKEMLYDQPDEIREKYGERLEEEFEPTEMGMYTIEQVLARTIYHEGLHAAAIQFIKRNI
ncbi:DinB family protein [Ornithinibacillus xuwenensis]|uniref:DinB family protein n=1 Tax=Ornithinibacillus xuwenensis TaxID=3144668 RepID=A0ABU9XEM3_9BACI